MPRLTLIYVFVFLISKISSASIIESTQSGNWTSPDTWLNGAKPISNDTVLIYPGDTIFINSSKASCYYLLNEGIVFFKSASNQLSSTVSLFNNGTITGSSLGSFYTKSLTINGNSNIDKCNIIVDSLMVTNSLSFTSNSGTKTFGELINNGFIHNKTNENIALNGNLVNNGKIAFKEGKISFLKSAEIYGSMDVHEIEITNSITNNDSLFISHKTSGNGYIINKGNLTLGMSDANFNIDSLDLSYPNNKCIFNREGVQSIPKLKNNVAQDIEFKGNGNYSIPSFISLHAIKAKGTSSVSINECIQVNELLFSETSTCNINCNITLNGNQKFGNITIQSNSNLTMNTMDTIFIAGDFNGNLLGSPIVVYNGNHRQSINPINYTNLVYNNSGLDSSVLYGNSIINYLNVIEGKLKIGNLSIQKSKIHGLAEIQIGGHYPIFTDTIFIDGELTINSNSASASFHFIHINDSGRFVNNSSSDISITSGIHNDGVFQGCLGTACDYNFTNNSVTLNGNDTIFISRINANNIENKGVLSIEKEMNVDTFFNKENSTLLLALDTQNISGLFDLSKANNTIIFNKNGKQNIPKCILKAFNIGFMNSGNKVLSQEIEIDNNIFITNYSNLKCDSFQITGNTVGFVEIDSISSLTLGHNRSSKNISFPTLYININLHDSSTVIYASKGNQTISSKPHYGNLIIDDGAIDSCEKTLSGDSLIVKGSLKLAESSLKLIVNDKIIDVKGDWNGPGQVIITNGTFFLGGNGNSDGEITSGSSQFIYNGNKRQRIKIMDYYNLTINKTGRAYTKANTGNLSVKNDTWVKNGTLDFNSELCRINHLIIDDSVTFSSKYQEKYFDNVTINSTGTFLLNYDEEIYFEGDIKCNGLFKAEKGVIHLIDTLESQTISGNGTIELNKTKIDKHTRNLNINCDITLTDTLFVKSGFLKINNDIQLKNQGYFHGESFSNPLTGSGKISLFKTIISGNYKNIGGLGLTINSSTPMGNTLVEREFQAYELIGKEGIKRVYNIEPDINFGLNVSLEFNFWESELNENNLTELEVYKSTDDGVNWSLQGGTIDTSNKTLQLHGISSFSKWTAGGGNITPLAAELIEFKGERIIDDILLEWDVYTEIRTEKYQINYSLDGLNFDSLTTIAAENIDYYKFTWKSAPNKMIYFSLIEIESSGKNIHLDTIIVMDIYKDPKAWFVGNEIKVTDFPVGTLNVYDTRGRLVLHNKTNTSNLKRGTYHIELLNEIGRWTYEEFKM